MQDIVKTENLKFIYGADENENKEQALKNVNLNIFKGEILGILGRNGSGKSTLAKIINALLIPTEGVCYVGNYNTSDENNRWEIRKMCGMVFQNPDNQIIGTSVEEDVAFGLENIGIPTEEMIIRIRDAMKCVGIYDNKEKAPHLLSGGQKQRVAIAGILAMKPECIILDEATAMLDPLGRKEVMTVVKQLNKEFNITIIHITHHMDEAVMCDRVVVVDEGKIILEGKPNEIFQNVGKMKEIGLDVPQVTELVYKLNQNGVNMNTDILTVDEAIKELSKYII